MVIDNSQIMLENKNYEGLCNTISRYLGKYYYITGFKICIRMNQYVIYGVKSRDKGSIQLDYSNSF